MAGRGQKPGKIKKNTEKLLDLASRLCYTSFYLSDERFLFARFFCRRRPSIPHTGAERMAADARVKITLRCDECKQRNYNTVKNKKNTSDRLERSKYCPFCRKHTKHVETK